MRWGRIWLVAIAMIIAMLLLMFYSGMFMHGDR